MQRAAILLATVLSMSPIGAIYRVAPVLPTPDSNSVSLRVVFPKNEQVVAQNPLKVQMRIEGYPLSVMSSFDRAKELRSSPKGQTVHVILDNNPYFELDDRFEYNYDQQRAFNEEVLNFHVPYALTAGEHLLRAFPTRSYGESVKDDGAFALRVFYMKDTSRSRFHAYDPNGPLLTYNEPQGLYSVSPTKPILLDFYVSNCKLSEDGYKVRLSINGEFVSNLTAWLPYYMYGFEKGTHVIKLELINKRNENVPGLFNIIERVITVQ